MMVYEPTAPPNLSGNFLIQADIKLSILLKDRFVNDTAIKAYVLNLIEFAYEEDHTHTAQMILAI